MVGELVSHMSLLAALTDIACGNQGDLPDVGPLHNSVPFGDTRGAQIPRLDHSPEDTNQHDDSVRNARSLYISLSPDL